MHSLIRQIVVMVLCLTGIIVAKDAFAAFSIINGGFDAQGAEVNNLPEIQSSDWFTQSNAAQTWSDAMLHAPAGNQGAWDFNGLLLGSNGPAFAVDGSGEPGYVYQSIGTYSGEASITITGYVFNRTNSNPVGDFDVALFYSEPGAFTPGVGVDLTGSAAVLISEKTFTETTLALPGDFPTLTGATAQSAFWSNAFTLTGSGVTSGDSVWLRIADGGNPTLLVTDQPVIDNLNIAPNVIGDVNGGGATLADLTIIRNNFRKSTAVTRAMGDLDGSGDVDFLDYFQWRTQYLLQNPLLDDAPGLFDVVPEPSSAILLLVCGTLAGTRRGRLFDTSR
ncbi:MAG: hypothetical protein SH868_19470 [Bythopirellula sp.]|nr:hypothetical protein [Bythopirellula sp.]